MKSAAKPWIVLCVKCVAVLCLIGAFIAFMKLNERTSELHRLRTAGVVSRAVVTDKEVDTVTRRARKGRTTTSEIRVLTVRHNPKSTLAYADLGTKVQEADLPPPLPESQDAPTGIMHVSTGFFEQTNIGDVLTVVNTPYNPGGPELYTDIRDFKPDTHYQFMGLLGALAVMFWFIARRINRARAT